jgi:hypothetical protein
VTALAVVLAAGVAVPTADGRAGSPTVGVGIGVDTAAGVEPDGDEPGPGHPAAGGTNNLTDTDTHSGTLGSTSVGSTGVDGVKLEWHDGGADRTPPSDRALSADRRPVWFSACLGVRVAGGSLRLGADTSTRVRVRNVATGETVTFEPDDPDPVAVDWLSVCPYAAPEGALDVRPTGFDAPARELSAPASGDIGTFSRGGYDPYVVEVLDGTGAVRAATPPRTHGVGVAVESLAYNGSALALDTSPAPPPDVTPVVVTADGGTIERLRMTPTRSDGEFVASVEGTGFDPAEAVYVELRRGGSDGSGGEGPPLVTLFRLSILPDERVEGSVGRPIVPGPPPLVEGRAPSDPDGDGVYEDVDGSGSVTILDVATLLAALDDPTVRHAAGYDVDGSGSVTILDVAALLADV